MLSAIHPGQREVTTCGAEHLEHFEQGNTRLLGVTWGEVLFSEGDSVSHHVLQGVCTILRADLDE
jgi:hypothetical protein